jgi:DNA-binding transcriptional LysR family regulator
MDVRSMLDIKAICDASSYRRAADVLGATQPTLSNRIAYLEGQLGAQLFDREHGRSRPVRVHRRAGCHATAAGSDGDRDRQNSRAGGPIAGPRPGYRQLPGRVMCSAFESLVRLVMTGSRYFTAGPIFAFAPEIQAGRLRVLDTRVPFNHQVALHTNTDALPIPAVEQVMRIIREVFEAALAR